MADVFQKLDGWNLQLWGFDKNTVFNMREGTSSEKNVTLLKALL